MIKKIQHTFCYIIIILISSKAFALNLEKTIEEQNWSYIQSVGGFKIGKLYFKKENWYLEIKCDVSGLREITNKPTELDSFHVCRDIKVEILEKEIRLTVITSYPDGTYKNALCNDAKLGTISDGEYNVYYMSPNEEKVSVGKIKINS